MHLECTWLCLWKIVRSHVSAVTHDSGTEFARHVRLRDEVGVVTYFADPVQFVAARQQREQELHGLSVSAETLLDCHGDGSRPARD